MVDSPAIGTLNWRLAWGVVALQGALQLGWMVYRAYQPTLLGSFGFGGWVFAFSLLPGLLGLVVEPLAGAMSDRLRGEGRGRVVPITLAVLVAGMLFLTIVGLVGSALPRGWLLLPALMLAWQIAVQIAASPNLALFQEAAPLQALPRLAALSVVVQGLIGAFESTLTRWALQAGPALTFVLAAGVLLLGLGLLRAAVPLLPAHAGELQGSGLDHPVPRAPVGRAASLLLLAVAAGLAAALARELLPARLLWGLEGSSLFHLGAALGAPWAGRAVARVGAGRAFPTVLALAVGTSALTPVLPPVLDALGVSAQGVAWGGVATTLTALALGWLVPAHGGLAAGLLLAGTGLSVTLLPLASSSGSGTGSTLVHLAVAAALALGWFWLVGVGDRRKRLL
jgi:hypothetical protein